jgi:hypothetical protein
VLLNPETRRQFDSIDPAIEDHVPSAKDVSADDFSTFLPPGACYSPLYRPARLVINPIIPPGFSRPNSQSPPTDPSLPEKPDSARLNRSLRWARWMLKRKTLKSFTTFGTTLIVGGRLRCGTRRSMRVATGESGWRTTLSLLLLC